MQLARTRSRFEEWLYYIGDVADLAVQTVKQLIRGPLEKSLILAQFDAIGVKSISIAAIT